MLQQPCCWVWYCGSVQVRALIKLLSTPGHQHGPTWLYLSIPSLTFCGTPSFHAVVFHVHPNLRIKTLRAIQMPWPAVSGFAFTTHHLLDQCSPKKYSHSWQQLSPAECQSAMLSILPLCHPRFSLARSCISGKLSSSWMCSMDPFFGPCLFPPYFPPVQIEIPQSYLPPKYSLSQFTKYWILKQGEKAQRNCFLLPHGTMACCIHVPLLIQLHTRETETKT